MSLVGGRFTLINGYPSAAGPVQASESSPFRDRRNLIRNLRTSVEFIVSTAHLI